MHFMSYIQIVHYLKELSQTWDNFEGNMNFSFTVSNTYLITYMHCLYGIYIFLYANNYY